MKKVYGKDIAWLLCCKECFKTLKIKDVKEPIHLHQLYNCVHFWKY